jgi:hypothetical protein
MWAMGELEIYSDPKRRAAEVNRRTILMFAADD